MNPDQVRGSSDSSEDDEEEVYDLDLEQESDSDPEELIREAVEAVDARVSARGDHGSDATESSPPSGESFESSEDDEETDDLSSKIRQLELELAEARDQSVRVLADYENFRRRTERSRVEERRYAAEPVLRECLEVVDNLDRALSAEGESQDLKQGVEMIYKQLRDILQRAGVEPIQATGERFDPSVHEAVARVESDDVTTATVVEEYQRGFKLHDRLLRAAMVVVAVPNDDSNSQAEDAEESKD